MGLQQYDSFDLYNGIVANTGLQSKYTIGGSQVPSMVTGRFGAGQAVSITPTTSGTLGAGYFARSFPGSYSSFAVGQGVNFSALANQSHYFLLLYDSAGGTQLGVRETSAGALAVDRATGQNTGTQLGITPNGVVAITTDHHIELAGVISDTVGTIQLKVDGVVQLTLTGQDTKNTANANVASAQWGHGSNSSAANCTYKIDDYHVCDDSTGLGARRVRTLYGSADVAQGFSRSSGSANFSLVNEAQVNGDTSYVEGQAVGTVDTYDFDNLPGTPTTIDAVQFSMFVEATDAAARSVAAQAISGVTTSDGSDFPLAGSYAKKERMMVTDPNTAAAWAAAAVNALRGGPKVTA